MLLDVCRVMKYLQTNAVNEAMNEKEFEKAVQLRGRSGAFHSVLSLLVFGLHF